MRQQLLCRFFRKQVSCQSPGKLLLARRLLGDHRFCKSLIIKDLHKEGPHSKFHAKLHLARRLFSVFAQVFGPAGDPIGIQLSITLGKPFRVAGKLFR